MFAGELLVQSATDLSLACCSRGAGPSQKVVLFSMASSRVACPLRRYERPLYTWYLHIMCLTGQIQYGAGESRSSARMRSALRLFYVASSIPNRYWDYSQ